MALIIRFRQQGRNNRQTFRLVVADERSPRDGKYLEKLGWYQPFLEKNNISIDVDRVNYWLGRGAQMSENAKNWLGEVAPDALADWQKQRNAKRTREAAKRRAAKKKA